MEAPEVIVAQKDKVRVKRKTLEAVLQQCHWALQQLASGCDADNVEGENEVPQESTKIPSAPTVYDNDTAKFYGLFKSGVEGADFIKKLENAKASLPEEYSSWDMVDESDIWDGNVELDREGYVLVGQEDIMDGIATFMTAYLLSLKETKDLSPDQLQAALCKTFSVKKRKGTLRMAWDGSKIIYNVASWGATAIGIYQNPALFGVASTAYWTSCRVISKFF